MHALHGRDSSVKCRLLATLGRPSAKGDLSVSEQRSLSQERLSLVQRYMTAASPAMDRDEPLTAERDHVVEPVIRTFARPTLVAAVPVSEPAPLRPVEPVVQVPVPQAVTETVAPQPVPEPAAAEPAPPPSAELPLFRWFGARSTDESEL